MAASVDGVVHLAYLYGSNPAHVVYRRCAGACDQAASWQHLEFTSPCEWHSSGGFFQPVLSSAHGPPSD
ncbi:MAG: hypothetical protein AMXMBFR34_53660 [Myxococcaceae bacterium]